MFERKCGDLASEGEREREGARVQFLSLKNPEKLCERRGVFGFKSGHFFFLFYVHAAFASPFSLSCASFDQVIIVIISCITYFFCLFFVQ